MKKRNILIWMGLCLLAGSAQGQTLLFWTGDQVMANSTAPDFYDQHGQPIAPGTGYAIELHTTLDEVMDPFSDPVLPGTLNLDGGIGNISPGQFFGNLGDYGPMGRDLENTLVYTVVWDTNQGRVGGGATPYGIPDEAPHLLPTMPMPPVPTYMYSVGTLDAGEWVHLNIPEPTVPVLGLLALLLIRLSRR